MSVRSDAEAGPEGSDSSSSGRGLSSGLCGTSPAPPHQTHPAEPNGPESCWNATLPQTVPQRWNHIKVQKVLVSCSTEIYLQWNPGPTGLNHTPESEGVRPNTCVHIVHEWKGLCGQCVEVAPPAGLYPTQQPFITSFLFTFHILMFLLFCKWGVYLKMKKVNKL